MQFYLFVYSWNNHKDPLLKKSLIFYSFLSNLALIQNITSSPLEQALQGSVDLFEERQDIPSETESYDISLKAAEGI